MNPRRPYVRPMAGWWRRDPFFIRYMVREATAIFVAVYALILLIGLLCLSLGETAYNAWLAVLKSPASLGFHVVLLAAFLYHTWSWFSIMPKTMPTIVVGGRNVKPATIVFTGLIVAGVSSVILLIMVLWVTR